MLGFDRLHLVELIFVFYRPVTGRFIVGTASYSAGHLESAAPRLHLFRANFPHHARPPTWITKRVDERLDDSAAVAVVPLRNERVLDGATERKSSDALRGPVCRNFPAAHPPDFFGVALKECVEEPFAELIAYPLFEIARIPHRKQTRFQPGKDTQSRFDDTELHQCFDRFERIRVKFAVIENARRTWPHEHVVR